MRGLHVERPSQQQLPGCDDFTHDLAGTLLPRHRRRIRHFPPPAAELDLGGEDDPHRIVYGRRQPQHGVALDRLTIPIA